MIPLLLPLAIAAEPVTGALPDPVPDPVAALAATLTPVERVACARPVDLARPYPWTWTAEPSQLRSLLALVVVADPELLRPRQVGQRVLYADGWPLEVLAVEDDRALVLAPFPPPADGHLRVFFGDDRLPEQVDAPRRAELLVAAQALTPQAVDWRGTPRREITVSRGALVLGLKRWMETCEASGTAPPDAPAGEAG